LILQWKEGIGWMKVTHQTFDILIVALCNAKKRRKTRENAIKRNNAQPQQFSREIRQRRNKFG
jgi:hypothetical protein